MLRTTKHETTTSIPILDLIRTVNRIEEKFFKKNKNNKLLIASFYNKTLTYGSYVMTLSAQQEAKLESLHQKHFNKIHKR